MIFIKLSHRVNGKTAKLIGMVEAFDKNKKTGAGNYGKLNFLDYLVPDQDPDLKVMEQESEERTLARYTHNRKKVYGWTQATVLLGSIAAAFGMLVFGGNPLAFFEVMGFAGITEGAAAMTSLAVSAVAGVAAFVSGYYAFRTDIKNDVDIEEMLAKRVGRHVGHAINRSNGKEPDPEKTETRASAPAAESRQIPSALVEQIQQLERLGLTGSDRTLH